jgi:hypothetical protein
MKQINMDTGGAAYLELLTWCLQEIEISHKAENAGDHPLATQLRSCVTALRDRLATLYNFDDQPVPFFYVHFTCLVSVYYLPLFAVDTALSAGVGADANWVSEIVAALIVLLQLIFVIGLRVLAIKLANPYGSDNEDLSVIFYVRKFILIVMITCPVSLFSTSSFISPPWLLLQIRRGFRADVCSRLNRPSPSTPRPRKRCAGNKLILERRGGRISETRLDRSQ